MLRSSVIFFILLTTVGRTQTLPFTWLYDDEQVYSIYINLPADSLEDMFDNLENEYYYHATFIYTDGITADTVEDIGLRLRGNTSLYSAKKSYKVSFNTYSPGRKYEGVEKLNLLGMHNDPTMVREHLYFDTYIELGLPEHRSNFVRLYLNGEYFGLYTNMEHIDEVYVNDRFGNNDGNLYKCTWPADLNWRGSDQNDYLDNGYELHINEDNPDASDLIHFIDVLNNTPIADLPCELEKVFNVQEFLKTYALDVAAGHWDNYGANINNYYLYHNLATDKFEFLSFDCDNTFGVDWLGFDWTNQPIYDWPTGWYDVPLVTRLMEVDTYRKQFGYYLEQIHQTALDPVYAGSKVLAWRDLVAAAALEDDYRTYDWGYTYDDFWDGFTDNGIDGHTPYGIIPFIQDRTENTFDQLEPHSISPIITQAFINPYHPATGENCQVLVQVEDDGSVGDVTIHYQTIGDWQTATLHDDGMHDDQLPGDGWYGGEVYIESNAVQLAYTISATDDLSNESVYPSCDVMVIPVGSTPLQVVINEVMSSNITTIQDEAGDFEDYIELYNSGNTTISLYGYYLSDDPAKPWKWQLPNTTMAPDSYILIWADDEGDEGDYHAGFKIDVDGETIAMYGPSADGYPLVEQVEVPSLDDDISWGRLPNGTGEFTFLPEPSPGKNNETGEPGNDPTPEPDRPYLTNNPSKSYSELRFDATGSLYYEVWMSDASGRNLGRIYSGNPDEGHVNVGISTWPLPSGTYFLRLVTPASSQSFVLVVL